MSFIGECMMVCPYSGILHSGEKEHVLWLHATTTLNLKCIILSVRSGLRRLPSVCFPVCHIPGKANHGGIENIDQCLSEFNGMGVFDHRGVSWRVVELLCILIVVVIT